MLPTRKLDMPSFVEGKNHLVESTIFPQLSMVLVISTRFCDGQGFSLPQVDCY